ncbi:hypothetical protein FOXYSP1_13292 [Fusarium oxysporum f. sp. phaseoli]
MYCNPQAFRTSNMYMQLLYVNPQPFYPPQFSIARLFGERSRSIRLIRLNNLGTSKLLIGISRPDDLTLRLGHNGESGEAVVGAELVAPARGDGEVAAGAGAGAALLAGAGALDVVAALVGLAVAGVDAELPVADGIVGAAVALGVTDGPLGGCGHHVDALSGGCGCDAGGGEEGEDCSGELHFERCL